MGIGCCSNSADVELLRPRVCGMWLVFVVHWVVRRVGLWIGGTMFGLTMLIHRRWFLCGPRMGW